MSNDMNGKDDESSTNGGEIEYDEIRRASDAHKVEEGDTVWVKVDAIAERADPEELDWAPELYDEYEAEVTDVSTKDSVGGGQSVTVTVDNDDAITVSGDGLWLNRGVESYWNRDHNNSVHISLKIDDEASEGDDESNTNGGETNADNIWAAVPDDGARLMTDGGVDVTDESNGGENHCVEIQNADDAQHVESGDTVSVEINAYPECDDRERAFWKGTLTDSYEATVTDVAENRTVHGIKWGLKLTLDNGDELSICSDGARELKRDNEWYTSYDTHYPENKVSIAVVADDVRLNVEGGEVVSDEALDRIEDMVSEMGHAGSLIQYELRDSKQGNDEIRKQANTIVGASNRFDQLLRDLRNSGETDE